MKFVVSFRSHSAPILIARWQILTVLDRHDVATLRLLIEM